MGLRDEIRQQPAVMARLLDREWQRVSEIAGAIRRARVEHVVIAARGSSDHAAIYAQYVFGVRHRLSTGLAAPSILTVYGSAPDYSRALVLGISQSGASPDVVEVVATAQRQGAPTVALTNDTSSPLAGAALHVIPLGAGAELATAATKTYTAELLAIAMLSAALLEEPRESLLGIPEAMATALAGEEAAAAIARGSAPVARCVVLGRGYEYATAREWALKLKELARVLADPYSTADFQHGPLTLLEPGFPVFGVATAGSAGEQTAALMDWVRRTHGAATTLISDDADTRVRADHAMAVPPVEAPHLAPLISIVPAQLFAMHLAVASGMDPDNPRHIQKVTRTL